MSKRFPRVSDAFGLHLRPMTDAEIAETARGVWRKLLSKLDGPPEDIQSWINLAKGFGLRVLGFKGEAGDPPGYYGSVESQAQLSKLGVPPGPVLYYNVSLPYHERILVIIHELAHHVAATSPGSTWGRVAMERYDDNRHSAQHRVACCVEELARAAFFCVDEAN